MPSPDSSILPWHVLLVLFIAVQSYSIRTLVVYPPAFMLKAPKKLPPMRCDDAATGGAQIGSVDLINEDNAMADVGGSSSDGSAEQGEGGRRRLLSSERKKSGVTTAADVASFLSHRSPACKLERIGGGTSGGVVCGDHLRNRGVVYSFGVGKDLSFEGALSVTGQQVFVFDPFLNDTVFSSMLQPIKGLSPRRTPQFRPFALGQIDGVTPFYPSPDGDGFSAVDPNPLTSTSASSSSSANEASTRAAAVLRLRTFMCMYSHRWIDVLRLDINGLELDLCESDGFGTSVGDLTQHGAQALAEKTPVGPTPGSVPVGQLVVRFREKGVRDAGVRRETCERRFEQWGLKKVHEDKASGVALFARTDAVASE